MSMLVTHIYCGFHYRSHENMAVHKKKIACILKTLQFSLIGITLIAEINVFHNVSE
jgi:hypothetical protein